MEKKEVMKGVKDSENISKIYEDLMRYLNMTSYNEAQKQIVMCSLKAKKELYKSQSEDYKKLIEKEILDVFESLDRQKEAIIDNIVNTLDV